MLSAAPCCLPFHDVCRTTTYTAPRSTPAYTAHLASPAQSLNIMESSQFGIESEHHKIRQAYSRPINSSRYKISLIPSPAIPLPLYLKAASQSRHDLPTWPVSRNLPPNPDMIPAITSESGHFLRIVLLGIALPHILPGPCTAQSHWILHLTPHAQLPIQELPIRPFIIPIIF